MRALTFHHIDPETKLFSIAPNIHKPLEELAEEAKKCQLLCFNCHMEQEELLDQNITGVLPSVIEANKTESKADENWQQYVGTYVDDWGTREVLVRNGQLQMLTLDFIDMPPAILEPTDTPHEFKSKISGGSGETARFEFDDAGNIVKFWFNNEYSLPKA